MVTLRGQRAQGSGEPSGISYPTGERLAAEIGGWQGREE